MNRRDFLAAAAALPVGLSLRSALAQDYPTRPIRLMVPFAPGGSLEAQARILNTGISEKLGQSLVISFRAGAGGMVGTGEVARAPADGYTIVFVFDTHATNHHLHRNITFDTFKDLRAVTQVSTAPMILSASVKSGLRTLDQVIERSKANPGSVSCAHPGPGSSNHLAGLQLQDLAGIRFTDVPYGGAGPMITALVGGHVDLGFTTVSSAIGQIKAGNLVGVAVGSEKELSILPGVPPLSATFPGFMAQAWAGILVPAGVSDAIVEKLYRATVETLADPKVQARLGDLGFVVAGTSPAEFDAFIREQSERWGEVIRKHGITAGD